MVNVHKFFVMVAGVLLLAACDLQPKIASIPDYVGEFISARYPALLADPVKEPEIYNSAAGDYGVYASPELYGSLGATDDYVNYAATDDYVFKGEYTDVQAPAQEPEDIPEQEVTADATNEETPQEPIATESAEAPEPEDFITVAEYKADELHIAPRAASGTVVVRRGDTLYAIARNNNTTVAELAEINNLGEPYSLRIGQVLKLKRPAPKQVEKQPEKPKQVAPEKKPEQNVAKKTEAKKEPVKVSTPKTDVRVPVKTVTVARGDTLYSLSRTYSVPVNDLAVMNGLTAPFSLSVGQTLRVPDLPAAGTASVEQSPKVPVKTEQKKTTAGKTSASKKQGATQQKDKQKVDNKTKAQTKNKNETKKPQAQKNTNAKAASAPKKQQTKTTPKIVARSSSKFSWPVRGKVLSHFGAKTDGLYNDGVNISAAFDSPVLAAENGVVAYAGNEVRGMGNLVIIQHADGWMTVYAHMNSMTVRRGADVKVGQKIGTVGQTGKVNKPQLHFEIRKGTKAYNPADYLK